MRPAFLESDSSAVARVRNPAGYFCRTFAAGLNSIFSAVVKLSPDSIQDAVCEILASVTGVAETRSAPDLKIRELGILDSLGVVDLIIALGSRFGIDVAPAEIEESDVATPRAIAEFVARKLGGSAE